MVAAINELSVELEKSAGNIDSEVVKTPKASFKVVNWS